MEKSVPRALQLHCLSKVFFLSMEHIIFKKGPLCSAKSPEFLQLLKMLPRRLVVGGKGVSALFSFSKRVASC